jgi:hypothetical protein
MTAAAKEATQRALEYIREGVPAKEAVRRACADLVRERTVGMGDFAESWDTMTSILPWVLAAIAGVVIYRTGVKAHRAASDYIETKRRKFAAAKAVWDATL